ncbi:MAG: hypothetical protein ABIV28_04305 [Longimicrobiales bacterium]
MRRSIFITVRFCLLVACLTALPTTVRAQNAPTATTDTSTYQIKLADGSSIMGKIESRDATHVVIVTTSGIRMDIPASSIIDIRAATGKMVNGRYWAPDPNKTRLFFAPTARAVGNGQGYVGTYMVALPFIAYGVGDRITLAGGAPILFGQIQPFYIAPKITVVHTNAADVALGTIAVFSSDDEFLDTFGIGFAMVTLGTSDHALTGGIGYGYSGSDVAGEPAFMLGGETRIGQRTKLITENYFVAGVTGGILMGGLRILGERLTVDVGVLTAVGGDETFCCLPLLNFSYSFGNPSLEKH